MTKKDPRQNLKPFKPGQSGNPSGRPKLSDDLRAIQSLTADEINRMVAKYGRMNQAQLRAAVADPNTQAIELAFASALARAIKNGDYSALSFLLDRGVGRVANVVEGNIKVSDGTLYEQTAQLIKERNERLGLKRSGD